jgi:exonuclease SbcD
MQTLDPKYPSVLMGHVSLQGAVLGFEQSIMLGKDVTVGLDDLHARSFDYIALGHIHKHQQVGSVPPAVYAGSPERIDFGEEREAKGYVSVAIEPNVGTERQTSWAFVELPARPFRTVQVDASGDDPMDRVHRDIARIHHEIEGAIVRCVVEVDLGRERAVAPLDVRRALIDAGAAYVAHVTVESDTTTRAREHISEEAARDSLKMLERWMEGRKYDAAMRERVLERGRELIEQRQHHNHDG